MGGGRVSQSISSNSVLPIFKLCRGAREFGYAVSPDAQSDGSETGMQDEYERNERGDCKH